MSGRRAEGAHYLHAAKALEPVLAVPAEAPRALSWLGAKETLLLAQRDGRVVSVEPSFGARPLYVGPPDPVHLATRGGDIAVLSASGRVEVRSGGDVSFSVDTGLAGESGLRFWRGGLAVIGESAHSREVQVYEDGRRVRTLSVPEGTALGARDGELLLARSVDAEMRVTPLGGPLPDGVATHHTLRFAHGARVVGVVEGGVTVWLHGQPRTVRLLDSACGALAHDGRTLALGTLAGVVAIADVEGPPAARAHPARLEAHTGPVVAMSFSTRGRWLATVGDNCRLWAY